MPNCLSSHVLEKLILVHDSQRRVTNFLFTDGIGADVVIPKIGDLFVIPLITDFDLSHLDN